MSTPPSTLLTSLSPSTPPPLIRLPVPSIRKPTRGSNTCIVDIESLKWTLLVPEANEIVERALYRGFFDIIDRAELNRLRKLTEVAWNDRVKSSREKALARLEQYKKSSV